MILIKKSSDHEKLATETQNQDLWKVHVCKWSKTHHDQKIEVVIKNSWLILKSVINKNFNLKKVLPKSLKNHLNIKK